MDAEIRIEYQMTNPPRPISFGVVRNGNLIAVLKPWEVEDAVNKFREALGVYESERMTRVR